MPRMRWLPGLLPLRRLPAVVVAILLLASPPAAVAAHGTVAPCDPVEEPAPPGEDREDAPDFQPGLYLMSARLSNPSPGDRRAGNPPCTPSLTSRFSLLSPGRNPALFGDGLCFRLRC